MQDSTFPDIDFVPFSSFTFKVNHVFMGEREKLVEKIVINAEELDGIDTDDILDSEISLKQCSSIRNIGI